MDSPHLLHLGFLLLALAVLHPDTAMSSDDSAKGPKHSSSGSTTVTVYHCKDCESSTCQARPISFENFKKIAETQNTLFSNGIIEMVTTETHILACFKQANSFPEGIFGIVWEKAEGAGHSCGILNSEENGRGNISTEENEICCEAETNLWEPNPTLKCYPKPKRAETRKPTGDIPGNPECPTSQTNSFGILFTVVVLGFLAGMGTMYCYFWHRHRQASRQERQGPERENRSASRTVLLSCDVQQPAEQQTDFP